LKEEGEKSPRSSSSSDEDAYQIEEKEVYEKILVD
jgi:hypothetical protein